jgi:hypothetical protein
LINGKDPRPHGFDFGLWTRLVVRRLIAEKFDVNLGITAIGKLLAKLGLTPQKSLKRAYERDPAAIEAWKLDTYPSIAKRAKQQGAEIYFWDESGFRGDALQGTRVPKEKHRLLQYRANDNRSRRRRLLTPKAASGLQPTRAP